MTRPEVRTLRDAAPLAALAHPFRSRIMDALKVDGPSTASMLAARTGQAVGNASHHLKVLAAAGLVEEAPELARDRRERWWRLVSAGTRWSRRDLADQAAVTAAEEAEALVVRRQHERVRDWMANAETDPEWDDAAFATQHWMRLSPDELKELTDEVIAVFSRWSNREVPDDGIHREPVFAFARAFPSQP
jgi:DNA-binding transcriptional ArsR family regulator